MITLKTVAEGNTMKKTKNALREFKEVWNSWKGFINEADKPSYNAPFALNAISQRIKKGFEELPGFQEVAMKLAGTSGSSQQAAKKEVGDFMRANMPKIFQQMAIGGDGSPASFIASQEGVLGKEGVGYAVAKGLQQVEVPGLSAEQSSALNLDKVYNPTFSVKDFEAKLDREERRKPTNMPDTPYRVKPAEVDPEKNPEAARNFFSGQYYSAANTDKPRFEEQVREAVKEALSKEFSKTSDYIAALEYLEESIGPMIKEISSQSENDSKGDEIEEGGKCTKATQKTSSTRKGKKWMKCIKNPDGKGYVRRHWGQKGVRVTGDSGDTKRKKSFRARHGCEDAKPGTPKKLACDDW